MIPRYTRPEMAKIWSDQSRYEIWLEIELLALEEMSRIGLVPKETPSKLRSAFSRKSFKFNLERILQIEQETKHDVIAFLTYIAEEAGIDAHYLHRGMTSSDVLDTALAVQLRRSSDLILDGIDLAIHKVRERALEFKHTPCVGRSHGIHAEPITFGLKLLSWCAELKRVKQRIILARDEISCGKIAGAVGTYSSVPPQVETYVMQKLGLCAEDVSTQVVARDRHAAFFFSLASLGSSIERFCVEIRHLQRSEVHEVEEGFSSGQKGSSAMPHKKNPILSENLTGLARLLRSYSATSLENVALWHERDISHSSVERVIAPDASILADFVLQRFSNLVGNLKVFPDRMLHNLEITSGLIFSSALLTALVDGGIAREEAYVLVQKHALAAWEGGPSLLERVRSEPKIMAAVGEAGLKSIFDLNKNLKNVDFIFERVINE